MFCNIFLPRFLSGRQVLPLVFLIPDFDQETIPLLFTGCFNYFCLLYPCAQNTDQEAVSPAFTGCFNCFCPLFHPGFRLNFSWVPADFPGTGILCILYAIIIAMGKANYLMIVTRKADDLLTAAGKADDFIIAARERTIILLQQESGRFK